jgi:hypothetical protein
MHWTQPVGADMVDDLVFVVTALVTPATLVVNSGTGTPQTFEVKAGMSMSKAVMGVGKQIFELKRGSSTVLSGASALDITDTPTLNSASHTPS